LLVRLPSQLGRGPKAVIEPAASNYVKGAGFGLAAVSIWASLSAVTRMAVTTNLSAWDIAALRYGVAGLLLAPVVLRRGLARDRLGGAELALMVAGAGAPYALLQAGGLRFASAADQGALNPGFMPLFVTMISAFALGEQVSIARKLGLALILLGAFLIVGWHAPASGGDWSASRTFGHALFLCAAFLWACFTIVMRRAKLDPVHAVALVSTGSFVIYMPIYLPLYAGHLAHMPLAELAFQAFFQGILVTVLALILYARAVAILGASGAAAFGALVPMLSALFAIPLLGEWPTRSDWVALTLVSVGVYLATGAPLPRWKKRQ
jgi:drug/metabolite transporter (DMT)-like permease